MEVLQTNSVANHAMLYDLVIGLYQLYLTENNPVVKTTHQENQPFYATNSFDIQDTAKTRKNKRHQKSCFAYDKVLGASPKQMREAP